MWYLTIKFGKHCRYCAEVLASLPFTCPDEPLYLIYDINRVIHLRAGAVEANLKRWVSMNQHQDMMGVPSLSRDGHVAMHEPGGYSEHNLGDVSDWMLNNPCSTSDVDITKLQVCLRSNVGSVVLIEFIMVHGC
jgi:cohesin loading factor subunit SCC2